MASGHPITLGRALPSLQGSAPTLKSLVDPIGFCALLQWPGLKTPPWTRNPRASEQPGRGVLALPNPSHCHGEAEARTGKGTSSWWQVCAGPRVAATDPDTPSSNPLWELTPPTGALPPSCPRTLGTGEFLCLGSGFE